MAGCWLLALVDTRVTRQINFSKYIFFEIYLPVIRVLRNVLWSHLQVPRWGRLCATWQRAGDQCLERGVDMPWTGLKTNSSRRKDSDFSIDLKAGEAAQGDTFAAHTGTHVCVL